LVVATVAAVEAVVARAANRFFVPGSEPELELVALADFSPAGSQAATAEGAYLE
jgi:hypothetical protein